MAIPLPLNSLRGLWMSLSFVLFSEVQRTESKINRGLFLCFNIAFEWNIALIADSHVSNLWFVGILMENSTFEKNKKLSPVLRLFFGKQVYKSFSNYDFKISQSKSIHIYSILVKPKQFWKVALFTNVHVFFIIKSIWPYPNLITWLWKDLA